MISTSTPTVALSQLSRWWIWKSSLVLVWRLIEGTAAVGQCLQELYKHTRTNAFLTGCKRNSPPRCIHSEKISCRLEAIKFICITFSLIKETELLETALKKKSHHRVYFEAVLELPIISLGLRSLNFYFLSMTLETRLPQQLRNIHDVFPRWVKFELDVVKKSTHQKLCEPGKFIHPELVFAL